MHKCFIVLLVWSVCPCLVYGQDTELKSVKGKGAIREYEKTTEELAKEYQNKLADLDKEFRMKSELVKARLFTNLNEALTEEARKTNLEEANKIDAEIKRYKAMPLPNLVQTVGAGGKMSKARFLESIEGEWAGRWGTSGNGIRWVIDASGNKVRFFIKAAPKADNIRFSREYEPKVDVVYEHDQWTLRHHDRSDLQFLGFMRGDRLIFLGWSQYKQQQKSMRTHSPDHVAFLKKK